MDVEKAISLLRNHVEGQQFKGYDPYDTLKSPFPFHVFGKWGPILAIQFQKLNPINIRKILGIPKDFNSKAMGLFLYSYCKLYKSSKNESLVPIIRFLSNWLFDNYQKGYSGYCWSYNFATANTAGVSPNGVPTVIHLAYITRGLFEYYSVFRDERAKEYILNSLNFVMNDIPVFETPGEVCFGYNPGAVHSVYNANIHTAEYLARVYTLSKNESLIPYIENAVNYTLNRQKPNGVWFYSCNHNTGVERKQIDFHQGFIIESLFEIMELIPELKSEKLIGAIQLGVDFYSKEQFLQNGSSKYRYPKIFPVDIHNQAQGIITFSKLSKYQKETLWQAEKVVSWTIHNMFDQKGFFYYRKHKFFTNKIPYIRWGQAWMLCALVEYCMAKKIVIKSAPSVLMAEK